MLSGEGNENGEKTIKGLTLKPKKNNFARAAHFFCTFLCRCFARLQRETSRNSAGFTFFGGNVVRLLVHRFFTTAHFHFFIVASSISHFPTATAKFSCRFFNKVWLLCFYLLFWLSVARFLVELPWPVAYFLFFSVCFFLYIPNLWTWQLI